MSTSASARLREVGPEGAVGLVVAVFGLLEVARSDTALPGFGPELAVLALVTAAAVALSRRAPAAALALVWLIGTWQLLAGLPPLLVQLALALVFYGGARWGRTPTVLISGASVPLGILIGFLALYGGRYVPAIGDRLGVLLDPLAGVLDALRLGVLGLGFLLLGAPWLAGLAVRYQTRARASRAAQLAAEEREAQTAEIARLRSEQARLAADVHDVVGHSLAVVLAQAESGQYLPDDDPARLKQTLATIATSARSSLQDVRAVLAPADATGATAYRSRSLEELLEGARRSGQQVVATESGRPQPLPPELAQVAYRVLQEMLTNAIRHGRRDTPVVVDRAWGEELRIQVVNEVVGTTSPAEQDGATQDGATQDGATQDGAREHGAREHGGRGLPGMRDRLTSVGGRLHVVVAPTSFTATAWLPVRR
ncbi:sensor histidine kinase [uncultured Modestobacter sp.]|uniref:sensor histidine kinase n=1 Tax=uncultured Modestobacter sp. TaxID=380048 RepID=UPI002611F9AC|nr:histidine kinase [uncultured Modestobacter sp.]